MIMFSIEAILSNDQGFTLNNERYHSTEESTLSQFPFSLDELVVSFCQTLHEEHMAHFRGLLLSYLKESTRSPYAFGFVWCFFVVWSAFQCHLSNRGDYFRILTILILSVSSIMWKIAPLIKTIFFLSSHIHFISFQCWRRENYRWMELISHYAWVNSHDCLWVNAQLIAWCVHLPMPRPTS